MVYIGRDGRVLNNQPWSISRLFSMVVAFFMGILFFIQSLIDPFTSGNSNGSSSDRRSFFGFGRGGGGGGGGGSGGGGGNGRGPPRPPRRPMGRINHSSDVTVPGGCSSCQG